MFDIEVKKKTGDLQVGKFTLSKTCVEVSGNPTFEEWQEAMAFAGRAESGVMWWIGDLLNDGEVRYGETYAQAMEATELEYQTVADAKYVSGAIEFSVRTEKLSFTHHKLVAPLTKPQQTKWLAKAEKEGLSVAELRKELKAHSVGQSIKRAGEIDGAYSVILADPPWEYGDQRLGTVAGGGAVAHYPSMSEEQICELKDAAGKPIKDLCEENAALFLWATAPCLPEAMEVIPAWGFNYKAQFIWDKVRGFNGHYNDVQHELLLIATRGSFVPNITSLPKSIVCVEKDKHSRKPDVFYEIIESLYPNAKRLELFARRKREGWESWGNEV